MPSTTATKPNSPPAEPAAPMRELEAIGLEVAQLPGGQEAAARLAHLAGRVERFVAEHEGMAEELLSVYEQLGAVFEVTRRLPEVHNEAQVIELFRERLRRSFAGRRVSMVRQRPGERVWVDRAEDLQITPWLAELIEQVCAQGAVRVETPPTGAAGPQVVEVMVAPVRAGNTLVCAAVLSRPQGTAEFRACDMNLLETLIAFCGDLIRNHRLVHELRETSIAMVRTLVTTVDQKDEYTSGHSVRVGYYARLLGARVGLNQNELQTLEWSALLHDIGKIGIRDDVLKKKGKLTPEELAHMREHPTRSFKVVQAVPQLAGALDGVLHHHEHYDGGGYPLGLKGDEIPLQARLIQIADIFDALTSTRSYRGAYDWRKALDILAEEAGTTVDPHLQGVFAALIRERLEHDEGAWRAMLERAERLRHNWEEEEEEEHRCEYQGA
ncbi:MAG TPA: HD-GYP domain-containing protein [Phycisphaerae bacterium]|nr:HD-GYP domain-containing protein [Phycisphaerae bacterium]HNU44349.1 HD-GYP domain-containing protein [Phycisphaerae bacterium]